MALRAEAFRHADSIAGAREDDFASLKTTVKGLHEEEFETMKLDGGNVSWNVGALSRQTKGLDWKLSDGGYIKAPSFVIDAPEFKVVNAGQHEETKGLWKILHAAWNDTTAHKAAFLMTDIKSVRHEGKAFVTSTNVGALWRLGG